MSGFSQRTTRCLVPQTADGRDIDDDYVQHWDGPEHPDAEAFVKETGVQINLRPEPCWVAVTVCGAVIDEDGEGYKVHYDSVEDAKTWLDWCGDYRVVGDEVHHLEGCDDGCVAPKEDET